MTIDEFKETLFIRTLMGNERLSSVEDAFNDLIIFLYEGWEWARHAEGVFAHNPESCTSIVDIFHWEPVEGHMGLVPGYFSAWYDFEMGYRNAYPMFIDEGVWEFVYADDIEEGPF